MAAEHPVERHEPLAGHQLLRSSDVDEARERVAAVFCPHRLLPRGRTGMLDARLNSVRLDRSSLTYLDYGAQVRITPGELESFYLVQMPLAGRATVACGPDRIESTPHLASVPTPTEPLDMWWDAGNPQLIVRFERAALEAELTGLLGYRPGRPLRFGLGLDLTRGAGSSFKHLVAEMRREVEACSWLTSQPLALAPLESALMRILLLGHDSNYADLLARTAPPALPRAVRRAVEHCEQHAHEPITVADLAAAAGVSVRSLQAGFAEHVGKPPTAYLREIRLRRTRQELLQAGPGEHLTVTDVALRWGFLHPSRFARDYRRLFGEAPSATLRR